MTKFSSHRGTLSMLSTSWIVQFVAFNTSKLSINLVNAWMATGANWKPDLPLSRHLRSTDHNDSFGKLKVTIIDHNIPSGMIKADRKGKASGLENLRPYHRMESMRKSNILSWLILLLVPPSRIMTYSLLNGPIQKWRCIMGKTITRTLRRHIYWTRKCKQNQLIQICLHWQRWAPINQPKLV
jgi:hypothetical protein